MTEKEQLTLSLTVADLSVAKISLEIAATHLIGSWHASRLVTPDKSIGATLEDLISAVAEVHKILSAPIGDRSRELRVKLESIQPGAPTCEPSARGSKGGEQ